MKTRSVLKYIFIIFLISSIFYSCDKEQSSSIEKGETKSLSPSPEKKIEAIEQKLAINTESLEIEQNHSVSTNQTTKLSWKSQNPAIASVDSKGNITGNKEGQTTIQASNFEGEITKMISVKVTAFDLIQSKNAPSGYSISPLISSINSKNQKSFSFTISNAPLGSKFHYRIKSDSGDAHKSGTGTIISSNQSITEIDLSKLQDGNITISLYIMEDEVRGKTVKSVVKKDTTPPFGYIANFNTPYIHDNNQNDIQFSLSNAEIGSTYEYIITAPKSSIEISGNGNISVSPLVIESIDLSEMPEGEITLSVTLSDDHDNVGPIATATIKKALFPDNYISRLQFNNSINDETSYTSLNYYDGKPAFDASNSAAVTNSPSLLMDGCYYLKSNKAFSFPSGTNSFSVASWVYTTAEAGDRQVWYWNNEGVYYSTSLNRFVATIDTFDFYSNEKCTQNKWYHLTYVYTGEAVILYINGSEAGRTTYSLSQNPNDISAYLTIGNDNIGFLWSGMIDDLIIYNYGLTPGQVSALYNYYL